MTQPKYNKNNISNARKLRNNPTDAENKLWLYLRKNRLNGVKFRRQQPIGPYIADFMSADKRLIIELDGGQHNDEKKITYDQRRDSFLKNQGYEVLRIWNNEIFDNIDGVLQYISSYINPTPKFPAGISTLPQGEGSSTIQPFNHSTPNVVPPLRGDRNSRREFREGDKSKANYSSGCPATKSEVSTIPEEESIKIACPAKINLTLKVLDKRSDGFHNIESIMQTIDLFDYLTISAQESSRCEINLSGTSSEIPYDEKNLVYKAAVLFFERTNISGYKIHIHIEKNIPVSAGLAGGSVDAAGTLYGLNKLSGSPLSDVQLHELCAKLGSDLNFCLEGGRRLACGRGEILKPLEFEDFSVSLIKPLDLGISAKEAYNKLEDKRLKGLQASGTLNDLEWAVTDAYPQLQKIKQLYPDALMSGSGSAFFVTGSEFKPLENCWVKNGLKAFPCGVREV
ncbi:MAG: 4-(cytidine 5'-diphospho)-2-C-methyl-D-erythritol kinase [Heliobacteriaceae bacterium]|jgi:4-diphosphocytidyl-2-C-methyl-D-erythritol kinase|nr:4-(cytidine 5'-diphospho)-2-C-methyl-D-erythritol kinase [Heliobacteriaceae bacterium]